MSSPWSPPDPSNPYQGWTPQPEAGSPAPAQGAGAQAGNGAQGYGAGTHGVGAQPPYGAQPQAPGAASGVGAQPPYGSSQGYAAPQASYGAQPAYGATPTPGYNAQPGASGYTTNNQWGWQSKPGIIPLRPLTIGDLFSGSFSAIRANPKVLFGFTIVVMAIVSLIAGASMLLSGLGFESVLDSSSDPQAVHKTSTDSANALLMQSLSSLMRWLATLTGTSVLTGMLAATVSQLLIGRKLTMSEAWTMTRPRAGSLIGSFLMANLVIISPIIVWLIGIIASAVFLTSSGDPDALGWFLLLVFVLIIPTLIVMLFLQAKLMFAPICAVLEEIGPIASLKRSWSLVKGELWPTVGRYILMSFIVGFIGGFIGTFIGIIGGVLSLAVTNDPDGTVAVAITTIFVTLGSSLMLPLSASYQTLMYTDLRIRKENFAVVLAQAGAQ